MLRPDLHGLGRVVRAAAQQDRRAARLARGLGDCLEPEGLGSGPGLGLGLGPGLGLGLGLGLGMGLGLGSDLGRAVVGALGAKGRVAWYRPRHARPHAQ